MFETIQAMIQESETLTKRNPKSPEMSVGDLKGRLKDGANLIDLYIEWSNQGLNLGVFWYHCRSILVDKITTPKPYSDKNGNNTQNQ